MYLRIIPKLDIKNHNLVKGVHLEGLRVLGDPKKYAENYYNDGADEIIYHDVVASLYQRNNISSLIKRTSENIFLPMIAGGGINNIGQVEEILRSGADRVFINTGALNNPKFIDEVVDSFGSSTLVVSIEFVKLGNNYICRKDFGREETNKDLFSWAKEAQDRGAGELVFTSIDADGTGKGFDLNVAEKISKHIKIPFILNGGISSIEHINDVLNASSPSGIALGSMLHYSRLDESFSNSKQSEGNINFLKENKNYKNFGKINIKDIKDSLSKKFKMDYTSHA
tara:strand:- start:1919 stop:2767 length:849 start_codon:yes stop_codon:yes gene_type:complete